MKCPFCKADNDRVVDSRSADDGAVVRRRRECLECSRRYTTYERIEEIPLRVVKKDGSRAPFDRNKIFAGLLKACEKTPVSMEQLERLVHGFDEYALQLMKNIALGTSDENFLVSEDDLISACGLSSNLVRRYLSAARTRWRRDTSANW